MPSPAMTMAAAAPLAPQALAAASNQACTVDLSTRFEGQIQIAVSFGTVAATAGLQVQIFPGVGGGPTYDTIAAVTFIIPATAATTKLQTIKLPTGKYQLTLTNLDATNGLTNVGATMSTIDAVS